MRTLLLWTLLVVVGCKDKDAGTSSGTASKAKSSAEVTPNFAELRVREEQYKVETGKYVALDSCQSASTCTAAWAKIGAKPASSDIACSYAVRSDDLGNAFVIEAACADARYSTSQSDPTITRTPGP
jgi:hypothetical protein